MNQETLDYKLLARYLSGSYTDEDAQKMQQWVQQSAVNEHRLEEFKYIWKKALMDGNFKQESFDAEQDWIELKKQIDQQAASQRKQGGRSRPGPSRLSLFMRIAAIFLIATLIGFFAYRNWESVESAPQEPVLQKITTDMGQRVNLTLADGTQVLLNANSQLKLPQVFEADIREVFLRGQAYFRVQSNPQKPFIIHLKGSVVRVLGTSFAVSAYPKAEQIQVVVKEGRVSFQSDQPQDLTPTIATSSEMVEYNKGTREVEVRAVEDLSLYLSWIDGYLKFKEAPMQQVAVVLERRYAVKVTFQDPQIKEMMLTALLKGRSIRNVLDVIAVSLKIEYRLNDNRVVFFEK